MFSLSLQICLQYHFPVSPRSVKGISIKRSLMFQREIKKKLFRRVPPDGVSGKADSVNAISSSSLQTFAIVR